MTGAGRGTALTAAVAAITIVAPVSAQTRPAYPGLTCNLYGPRHFCDPYLLGGLGQDLRLTIPIRDKEFAQKQGGEERDAKAGEIDNIRGLFKALRGCWVGPPVDKMRPGLQITVRFSINRDGNIIGAPHVTYVTHDVTDEQKATYYQMIVEGLGRCTPLHLTKGMGGAIAGRPLIIRYIETRGQRNAGGD